MARRRSRKSESALGFAILVALGLGVLGSLSAETWGSIGTLALLVVGFIVVVIVLKAVLSASGRSLDGFFSSLALRGPKRRLEEKTQAAVQKHMLSLVRRRRQLVQRDAYGHSAIEPWLKEIAHFVSTQIRPELDEKEKTALSKFSSEIAYFVEREVVANESDIMKGLAFAESMSPREYEHFCADLLREAGWEARVTTGSRDFGVDVVAEKGGHRLVLQCKMYSKAVGLKAVQEVATGRTYEAATSAAVVSNQRYTPAASQMASSSGVLLLHHDDLRRVDDLLKIPAKLESR